MEAEPLTSGQSCRFIYERAVSGPLLNVCLTIQIEKHHEHFDFGEIWVT